jgi:hypothetical protein
VIKLTEPCIARGNSCISLKQRHLAKRARSDRGNSGITLKQVIKVFFYEFS